MNHCETASSLSKDNESRTKCVEERERERKGKREGEGKGVERIGEREMERAKESQSFCM